MRVRVLKTFASDRAAFSDGDEVSLPDAQALDWIKAGLVQRVAEEPKTATRREPELAVRRR